MGGVTHLIKCVFYLELHNTAFTKTTLLRAVLSVLNLRTSLVSDRGDI